MPSDLSIWPEVLPAPMQVVGVKVDPRNTRTLMESGRIRNRRMFQSLSETWEVQWNFTADQFTLFKSFFETDLDNGARQFSITLFVDMVDVSFVGASYVFSRSDNLFNVVAVLDIAAAPVDLELTAFESESGSPFAQLGWGAHYSYTFVVTALASGPALGSILTVDLADNFSFISATGGIVPDSDGLLVFSLGTVTPSASPEIVIVFAANVTEGTAVTTAVVTTDSEDIDLSNNSATITDSVGIAVPHAIDTFESYSVFPLPDDLDGLNSGQPATRWAAGYASRTFFWIVPDTFETYTAADDLDGLDDGDHWASGYSSRYYFYVVLDTFESYTAADDLDGLNDGTLWDSAYASR